MRYHEITETATNTEAFQQWFGQSVVKDRNGPIVCFHATTEDFDNFHPMSHFGTAAAARQRINDKGKGFGARTIPVYLRIEKPLRVEDNEASDEATLLNAAIRGKYALDVNIGRQQGMVAACKAAGFDGLIYKNNMEHRGKDSYVIFDGSQVRSAISEAEKLELPDIEVGDEVLVGKFKNRKATVKGFDKDKNNQPVLKTDKGDQKLFKPRIAKLMTEGAAVLEPTPENIAKAREFAMEKWKERAKERYAPEPSDLSYSCKFTSLFAQQLFGGTIQGRWDHQFLKLDDGTIVDLNIDAKDVKELGDLAHKHDPAFFRGNRDWRDSMKSVKPRVMRWVKEFTNRGL